MQTGSQAPHLAGPAALGHARRVPNTTVRSAPLPRTGAGPGLCTFGTLHLLYFPTLRSGPGSLLLTEKGPDVPFSRKPQKLPLLPL